MEKSPGSVPAIATLLMEIAVVPSLLSVTDWTALVEPTLIVPKESACGVTVNVLIFPVAVPESDTLCEELYPEWLNARVASRVPAASGVKVIVTVQFEEAARLVPQVLLEITKSPAFVPEIPMLLIATGEVPMLLRVTMLGVPVEPTATLPHARLLGSMRTPTTRQPATARTMRQIVAGSRLPAQFRQTVLGWFALRVIVSSSGFAEGTRRSPRTKAMRQRNSREGPARYVPAIVLRPGVSWRKGFAQASSSEPFGCKTQHPGWQFGTFRMEGD